MASVAQVLTRGRAMLFRIHPARIVVMAWGVTILIGTTLLALPVSAADGRTTSLVDALFTATSAVCVTGLVVVDTGSHWSGFGQWVILCLFQLGGFGIMVVASLLALLIAGKLRMRMTLVTQTETRGPVLGEVRRVVTRIVVITVVIEAATALWLILRFASRGMAAGDAVYYGFFHALSAFNNAGFVLRPDSMVSYADDPLLLMPVAIAMLLGGIGFPVIIEMLRHRARRRATGRVSWSLHLKLTLLTSAGLLGSGTLLLLVLEWENAATLGGMNVLDKTVNAFFHSAMARSGGFNSVDTGAMESASLLATSALMFIGGGSGGTSGGIKVTTFAVLGVAIIAEVRGEPSSGIFGRRLAPHVLRQALTVALLGVGLVILATIALLTMMEERLEVVLFEAVSAFGTVGLSAGATGELPPAGKLIIIALMFIGRVGPITLVSALALRERTRRYQLPEERPMIG
ncbi:TrkH family potassium uptake protein [Streptomyces sp. YIM 98790]|uniref:TrkH family potassium uptake protein n=1 Tax=Streptomyces sp. YIM 98790 TaxID=2689077 RepID=UPI0037DCA4CF